MAYEIIYNDVDETDQYRVAKEGSKTRAKTQNYLVSAPPFCKYINGKWKKSCKTKYQQHLSRMNYCKNSCQTSSRVYQNIWISRYCFSNYGLYVIFDKTYMYYI